MPGYNDPFGGGTLQAAQVAYRAVALSASIATVWPPYAQAEDYLARIMDVTPSAGSLTITLPAASQASPGQDVFFTNKGAQTYTVLDAAGNVVMTVAAAQVKYLYLMDNATAAGTWGVLILGVGSSNLDAAALAGLGLKAITTTLNAASPVVEDTTTPRTIATSDRAKTYVWTGGAGAYNLPLAITVSDDFFFEVRNQGTGVLTITPAGGETIDDSLSIALQLNESAIIHAGTGAWFTVGRGRNTQFNFTQLVKAVTGGTATLTLTEAANVVQTYTGVLASNQVIVLPGVVQVYYIRNQTTGSFNFRVQSPTPGTVIDMPSGENAILFCDGTNVYNATTYVTTVTTFPALTVTSRPSNTIFALADRGSMNRFTNTFTQTFEPAATLASGWYVDVQNVGTGVITFDANGAETFNTPTGARATINMYPGEGFRIVCSGTGFDLVGRSSVVQLAPAVTYAAVVSPAGIETGFDDTELAKIVVDYSEASVTASTLAYQVKKTGAYLAANYSTSAGYLNGTGTPISLTGQTHAYLEGGNTPGTVISGQLTIERPTATTATQMMSATVAQPALASPRGNVVIVGNAQSTSAAIQGIQIRDIGGGAVSGRFVTHGYRG